MSTKIINFYAGPSAGKSTAASYIYYLLKTKGYNTELVREYVKSWAWSQRTPSIYDQIYILGKQSRTESMLYGKVDWIVTDSPVLQNVHYADLYCPKDFADGIKAATLAFYKQAEVDKHKHIHIFLKRNKPYQTEGRFQNEEQAKEVDIGLIKLFKELEIDYLESFPDEKDLLDLLAKLI